MAKVTGGGSRIVFGAILIVLGILFLLSQFGVIDFGDVLGQFWPLILIVIGLWQWSVRRFRLLVWPILLLAVGFILQLAMLGLFDKGAIGVLLGAVLIVLGLVIILRKARPRIGPAESEADVIDHWVVFGGVEEVLTTRAFQGGRATALFGGIELNLRGAELAPGEVRLSLTAIFGGIELRVPDGWNVVVDGNAILGGVEDKTVTVAGGVHSPGTLHIRAVAVFGGVEISR